MPCQDHAGADLHWQRSMSSSRARSRPNSHQPWGRCSAKYEFSCGSSQPPSQPRCWMWRWKVSRPSIQSWLPGMAKQLGPSYRRRACTASHILHTAVVLTLHLIPRAGQHQQLLGLVLPPVPGEHPTCSPGWCGWWVGHAPRRRRRAGSSTPLGGAGAATAGPACAPPAPPAAHARAQAWQPHKAGRSASHMFHLRGWDRPGLHQ